MTSSPADRAAKAEHSVNHLFGSQAFHVPGTYLGAVAFPRPRLGPWHYWWQAHLLDAIVDAAIRERIAGRDDAAAASRSRAHRLLRGMAVRSGGRVTFNVFFDDMAWLAIALGRVRDEEVLVHGSCSRDVLAAGNSLLGRLEDGCDASLGGGTWWNTTRRYKNTAATAPTALALLRAHRVSQAESLLTWLFDTLWDPQRGAFLDGIHLVASGSGSETTTVERTLYSYNSGPVLGAVLELAELTENTAQRGMWLGRAADIVAGAARQFTENGPHGSPVLKTHGGGDGGLFTGILARYLGQAAASASLEAPARETARSLVLETARALWDGRREFDPAEDFAMPSALREEGETVAVFSPEPTRHANESQRPAAPVELSTQVQAWTVLEAAARLA